MMITSGEGGWRKSELNKVAQIQGKLDRLLVAKKEVSYTDTEL